MGFVLGCAQPEAWVPAAFYGQGLAAMGNSLVTADSIQEGATIKYVTWERSGNKELWIVKTDANGWETW